MVLEKLCLFPRKGKRALWQDLYTLLHSLGDLLPREKILKKLGYICKYRRFIAGSTHVSRIINYSGKIAFG